MNAFEKILLLDQALPIVKDWQSKGNICVFTNGCFDLMHPGHLQYLERAKQLGHKLVVGLNSDHSVKRLKGEKRPIQPEQTRALHLAALACTDMVILFEEDTPLHLIESLKPQILVKGGDYKEEDIVGAVEIKKWGGKVEILTFVEGYSTTKLIQTIIARYG